MFNFVLTRAAKKFHTFITTPFYTRDYTIIRVHTVYELLLMSELKTTVINSLLKFTKYGVNS